MDNRLSIAISMVLTGLLSLELNVLIHFTNFLSQILMYLIFFIMFKVFVEALYNIVKKENIRYNINLSIFSGVGILTINMMVISYFYRQYINESNRYIGVVILAIAVYILVYTGLKLVESVEEE